MSESAPALVPIFRSDQQLRILGILFAGTGEELTIGALAKRASVAQATASREIARLAEHGIVVTRTVGRNKLVAPNWHLPWAPELRSILLQTVGIVGRLSQALTGIGGVEAAFVFGSWAARHKGEPGSFPRDVDVIVVGDVALRLIRRACRELEQELEIEINPIVVDSAQWDSPDTDPFIAQIQEQPLTPIGVQDASGDQLAY